MKRTTFLEIALLVLAGAALASGNPASVFHVNYDESAVPSYELPELMRFSDGRPVRSAADWPERRREILGVFAREMFGREPPLPEALECELVEEGATAAGLGIRRQYRMWFKADRSGPWLDWLVVIPNRIGGGAPEIRDGRVVCENPSSVPVALFLNYGGNHTLMDDPEIVVPTNVWYCSSVSRENGTFALHPDRRAFMRSTTYRYAFPLEDFLSRGVAVMGCCQAQISPDIEPSNGDTIDMAWHGVFDLWGPRDETRDDNPATLGAWAWALSRGLDLAERIPEIDAARSLVTGCSRLGKAALLAGARDERFAVVVPNQTGGGGVPLAKRLFGENVAAETARYPHWFCPAYRKYADNESALPFDQHWLLACVAPRALLVEGFNMPWFDPRGEFLSCRAASPAWELHGLPGLPAGNFPEDYETLCIGPNLGYVRRGGAHGLSALDWSWALDFAGPHFRTTGRSGSADSPYGVCAHLHRIADPKDRAEECRRIAEAGIGRVRFDFEWWRIQKGPGEPFDFSLYDACMADAEAAGLAVLPIIFGNPVPMWARPVWEHLDEWGRYVEAVVSRYGDRFSDIEIWNEENLSWFWHHAPDPAKYGEALKVAYLAAKRANPDVRVLLGGLSGIPMGYIEGIYQAGGGPFFDAMNIHPYNHPRQPEGDLDVRLEGLRALMAKYGDAEKPVVISEHGWPTHHARMGGLNVLLAGLKVAKPEQKAWHAVYAATRAGPDGGPPRDVAEALEEALPPGSSVEACFGKRLREGLAAGDVDLVVYPFDESFPVDTFEEVRAFVEKGGVLAALGGMPLWLPMRETAPGVFLGPSGISSGGASAPNRWSLKIDVSAWWIDDALPRDKETRAFPTEAAKAADFKGDPAGEPGACRFQTPKLLREGDEFIPLLTVKDAKGNDAAAASVTRFAGGGGLIISGLTARGTAGSAGEAGQARYLPRAMAISFAEGVDQFYWYNFRSREDDPAYSEHHFGLVHSNRTPKPALGAYSNFILARPPGSVQSPAPWHDEKREFFFPQWTRPDGTKAGILWTTGPAGKRELRFDADRIVFRTYTGLKIAPVRVAPGVYRVPVSGDPLYFEGGALAEERP